MQLSNLVNILAFVAVVGASPVALIARGDADAATAYKADKRSDADAATAYKADKRSDADTATAYKADKRSDADAATAYKADKRFDADAATAVLMLMLLLPTKPTNVLRRSPFTVAQMRMPLPPTGPTKHSNATGLRLERCG
ncbi:hypothetical protein LMH87_005652 [Akanthomyces muscarius]|uniref:Uncharacterized protein n=1 Tax=Akanthomyces muscarius TaxID=2231603 RepID=A0A9W8QMY6_AKAMU|nr:hypothetical protein LMH87_005652 [Akanthomyces muscarius]KAJ4163955.1 hypothetical protein LMH87_005652 [Akanthomyces muscarius]